MSAPDCCCERVLQDSDLVANSAGGAPVSVVGFSREVGMDIVHPRVAGIVEGILARDADREVQPSGKVAPFCTQATPSRIIASGVSSLVSTPRAFNTRTSRPMWQFLSMIAPSITLPDPIP